MSRLQKALFLSDKGYADLKKAIFACTLTNLAMLLPFCVTVMIFSEILTPFVNGGSIQWNHIWMLWGAGIVSAILVFLAAKNDYRKTYIASYKESNTTRLRIAEHSHNFFFSHFIPPSPPDSSRWFPSGGWTLPAIPTVPCGFPSSAGQNPRRHPPQVQRPHRHRASGMRLSR